MLINSCTKENLATNEHANSITQASVIPNVTDCGPGYHWDFNLKKCVPNNCEPGFHWDGSLGRCVFTQITVITNPNNPVDSSGARHNLAVNSLMGEVSSGSTTNELLDWH